KCFHLLCASISLQQGPISWVRIHRAHHAHSDTDADPHNQKYGFFYGHIGWTFLAYRDRGRSEQIRRVPPDLEHDRVIAFFEKIHYQIFIVSMCVIYACGGVPYLLWAGCFRTIFVLHATWSVNSIAHRNGYRRFPTADTSTNNPFVASITFG